MDAKGSLPLYLFALGADRANVAAWTDLSIAAGKAGKHKLAQWAALGNLAANPSADAHFLAANAFMYCLSRTSFWRHVVFVLQIRIV